MALNEKLAEFLNDLGRYAQGEIRTDEYSKVLYSTDASIYQVRPLGVFFPKSEGEVQAAVELAGAHQVPLLPRTSGSSLAGQAVNEAVILDLTRHLDQVLELNEEAGQVLVQPGIVLDELNGILRKNGLKFGPDPASSNRAAMGGIVANNSTGAHSILYGMTADHVHSTRVVLSDGSLVEFGPRDQDELENARTMPGLHGQIYQQILDLVHNHANTIRTGTPRHWRRCGGYNLDRLVQGGLSFRLPPDTRFNLASLVCGSEGTLAVMTRIGLNLVPLPTTTGLAILHFDALYPALESVPQVLEAEPSAVELLDNLGLTMCREVPEYARLLGTFLEGDPNCLLITEFYGENEKEIRSRIDRLEALISKESIPARVVRAVEPQIQENVWTVRKVGLGLLMSIKGDHKPIPFIEDAAVPAEHLAEYITRVEAFCNSLGTRVAYYAHASAGCIHVRPLINAKDARDVAKLREIGNFAADLLGEYGGSLSSEHGDGRARSWLNERFYGKPLMDLYRQVKAIFDPDNLLNPGNIVDGQPIEDNLRFGPGYQTIPVQEHLDFSADQGFHRAVEMCNGAGVCRKRASGTMCPSFMVTREEEHSTRGRANALRAALSGTLPASELTSPRMYAVMDLCVECKACKAECPSSVDMSKIKFEFLAHYHEQHGVPLRSRLFGNISRLNRLGSGLLAPLTNAALAVPAVKWGLERSLGISRRRQLPSFAAQPFDRWFTRRKGSADGAGPKNATARSVVLFSDCFTTFNEPEVARASTEVLEAAGFTVLPSGHTCCGRSMISKGLLAEAREAARRTLERLAPLADQGLPILGLEPSCLLTFRDEYRALLPGDERVELLAGQAQTLEEFVADEFENDGFDLRFKEEPRTILLHGHCHQKALVGMEPALKCLSLLPGAHVEAVDSGCCGMAGSFGYEAEHYEISMAMAERRLLPAVRGLGTEALVAAAGTSCRAQILHGSGRRAQHPAEILRAALIP